jgi:hypothetical protein
VTDGENPTISGTPADITQNTDAGLCTTAVTWTEPTAADNCPGVTLTSDIASGDTLPLGPTTVTYTATDAAGNTATSSFVITVVDTESPVITGVPADITQNTDAGLCTAVVTWTAPSPNDPCSGIASFSADHAPGDSFPVGTTPVTYTAVDLAGNTATATFTVTVTENESPTITGTPADITQSTDAGLCTTAVTWIEPTAADNCPDVTLSSDLAPGDTFDLGTTTVTYTATDGSGNTASTTFTVTVTDDESPTISGTPLDLSFDTDPGVCTAVTTWPEPTAADNCPGVTLTSDSSPGDTLPLGPTTVTYTATDAAGNTATSSFVITVVDNEDPVITGVPADITQSNDTGLCTAVVTWSAPSPIDSCSGIASFSADHAPGDSFPVGTTTVTYTAIDLAGNTATASFVITVTENESPTIAGIPADITQSTDTGRCTAAVTWTEPTAADNCPGVTLSSDFAPGDTFNLGTTTITYIATDGSGNTASTTFTVTVTDNESPTISGTPLGLSFETDPGVCTAVTTWPEPTAADNCPGVTLTSDSSPGASLPLGPTTVTYTATDAGGNTTTSSFVITVVDNEDPVITGVPANITQSTDAGLCTAVVTWTEPTAADNCPGVTLNSDVAPGATFNLGTSTITYTATDGSGNTSSTTFSVTVIDEEDPVITAMPIDLTLSTDPGACSAVVTWTPPVAEDNCAIAELIGNRAPGDTFTPGTTVVQYTATDTSGNSATATFTVHIIDGEAPTIVVGSDVTVAPGAGECSAAVSVPPPVTADNCAVATVTNDYNGLPDASGEYPLGVTLVTWTVTDTAGGSTTAVQTITVGSGPQEDCDGNGVTDLCDLLLGNALDCDGNGIPDSCDIASGAAVDGDMNGVPDACEGLFLRGDTNSDLLTDLGDPIFLLDVLFTGGSTLLCVDAGDSNDDGQVDVADVIYLLSFLFLQGAPPPPPWPDCGLDETPGDTLSCDGSACP